MTEKEIQLLVSKFLNGTASKQEEESLHRWYDNQGFKETEFIIQTNGESKEDVRKRLYASIRSKVECEKNIAFSNLSISKRWLSYAALVFAFLLVGIYVLYTDYSQKKEVHYTQLLDNDIGPGGENAIIELTTGEKIVLDSTKTGDIVSINGIRVNRSAEGILSLDTFSSSAESVSKVNIIRTPKGGYFQMKLPDGSKVWLNASSSIELPATFNHTFREIYLEGEAYFEVARHQTGDGKRTPFIVRTKEQEIKVLGTSFNVNSYPGDQFEYTTLIEGSVSVSPITSHSPKTLRPGQQSIIQHGTISVHAGELESVIAWKNGDFIFNHENLYNIMKKIERWYDVEVVYQNVDQNRTFSGAISRARNLSDVLKLMEMTGKVTFKIEGRRVLVMT